MYRSIGAAGDRPYEVPLRLSLRQPASERPQAAVQLIRNNLQYVEMLMRVTVDMINTGGSFTRPLLSRVQVH